MKIGIMGGTFNPIHQGHLILAELAREEKGLDRVIFLPSSNPPHKLGPGVVYSQMRMDMVELAIESNPYFQASDLEIRRSGLSYTVDSLREFRRLYPKDEFYLLLGGDSLLNIHKWKDYEEILDKTRILVMDRHSPLGKNLRDQVASYNKSFGNKIEIFTSPLIEISSTGIRERLAQGRSIKYLLPASVEAYIKEKEIYKGGGYDG